jgi:hypothetical protein
MSVYAVTFNKSETDEEKTVLQKLCISGDCRISARTHNIRPCVPKRHYGFGGGKLTTQLYQIITWFIIEWITFPDPTTLKL